MSNTNSIRAACACLLLALALVFSASEAFAQAQATSGQITGTVRDSNGAAVPSATVKATNTQTGLEQSATSSSDGIYRFVLLPPGLYNLVADASNFSKTEVKEVLVQVGQISDVNITLGVGGVSEAITITADAIQTTVSQPDAVLNETAINNLPINGRRFQDFVTLTPTATV